MYWLKTNLGRHELDHAVTETMSRFSVIGWSLNWLLATAEPVDRKSNGRLSSDAPGWIILMLLGGLGSAVIAWMPSGDLLGYRMSGGSVRLTALFVVIASGWLLSGQVLGTRIAR